MTAKIAFTATLTEPPFSAVGFYDDQPYSRLSVIDHDDAGARHWTVFCKRQPAIDFANRLRQFDRIKVIGTPRFRLKTENQTTGLVLEVDADKVERA